MKQVIAIAIVTLGLASCSHAVPSYDGNGNRMEALSCLDNELVSGMTRCLQRAAAICPRGFYWEGSTNHPLANQVTKPDPEMTYIPEAYDDVSTITLYNLGLNSPGGVGWYPRVTRNRGNYVYITVRCK